MDIEQEQKAHGFVKVLRLLDALKSVGLEEYPGVCTKISKATSYSKSRVSDMLSGKAPINSRFVKAVCAAFGTNEEYIMQGTGKMNAWVSRTGSAPAENIAIREALSVLKSMTEPDRCRAVVMLKEMRKVFDKEAAH
ncbi:MAG: helix-turn-helix transcriptional regulator [Geobacteraceae bacterium]|nr:helix-turn-helix transcriptional regulator [Geobacteraceae bacterium]